MSKEELLEKYGVVLENFKPQPDATIKITIDPDVIDIAKAGAFAEQVSRLYPKNSIFTTFKGVEIK